MDLTSLSDEKLTALIADAQAEQRARLEERTADLLAGFRTQAEALGLDPSKLANALTKRSTRRARSSSADGSDLQE